jgi:outer membrane receptor protein involved in Fe transport
MGDTVNFCQLRRIVSVLTTSVGWVCLLPVVSLAQQVNAAKGVAAEDRLEEVVVFGRGEVLIGKASAASEGTVGGDDLLVRPMLRVADLLEVVPGLIAAQHSGGGKANQYFLRGFNLDHGTDFTTYIDDVPWNLRTHGHGQGYLDVNGLIPEVVERIDYRKGPYRADIGDFAMAGVALMTTIDSLQRPFVAVEGGQYGWGRLAGGGTTELGDGMLTLLGQYKTYDGPWELPEDLQHQSIWGKYSQRTDYGMLKISVSGYHATWNPTEQIPESAVGQAVLGSDPNRLCADEFCALDTTANGETTRWILSGQLLADEWRATAYAQYYDWRMSSDPTYDYQIDQFDRRWTIGARYERQLIRSEAWQLTAGVELRYDDIGVVGVDHSEQGEFVENIGRNAVQEASVGIYSEVTWQPTDALRLTGGLRANWYDFDAKVLEGSGQEGFNSVGHATSANLTPKLGVAYVISDRVELYGNWGGGAHSNDARAVVQKSLNVEGLADGTGYEAGARFEVGDFKISTTYWWLNLSSELIFVGDSNAVEPRGASRRHGYELVAFWRPIPWLAIDGVYTGSNARYEEAQDDGGDSIEGSVKSAGELGVAAVKGPWEFSARLRYLGKYPLVPNNDLPEENADTETMLNLRIAHKFKHITLYGEVLNVFDRNGKDIVYYYENAYDAAYSVTPEGRISRAEEPRTVRVGVKYEF